MFAKAAQFHRDVSVVEDCLNLSVEADLCYCQGHASQIERVLFEGHPKYCCNHGRRTSDRKVRRRWGRAGNHATCCASRTPAGSVHHSRCLHTGHNNGVLHYLDSVFRSQGQTEGVEIRRSDAADRSNQRASQVQRGDLQKRREQRRATKVERPEADLRYEKVLRESCVLVQGRSCVRLKSCGEQSHSPTAFLLVSSTRHDVKVLREILFLFLFFFFSFNCELFASFAWWLLERQDVPSLMVFTFYV